MAETQFFETADIVTSTLLVGKWIVNEPPEEGGDIVKVQTLWGRPHATAKVPAETLTLRHRGY